MIKRLAFEALIDEEFNSYGVFGEHINVLKKRYEQELDAVYNGIRKCKNIDEAMWTRVDSDVYKGGIVTIVVDICEWEGIGNFAEE